MEFKSILWFSLAHPKYTLFFISFRSVSRAKRLLPTNFLGFG